LLLTEFTDEHHDTIHQFGTAFFIAPKYLLTAAHNVYGDNRKYIISLPKSRRVRYSDLVSGADTLECSLLATVYGKNKKFAHKNDMAILHCGSFSAKDYLHLSKVPPPEKAEVSVIGYPGEIHTAWIRRQPGINDIDDGTAAAQLLLPRGQLTVSQGTVTRSNHLISYHLSTCPGLSGSCVLYEGKVVGMQNS
jgi:V8-like Glu-specific endopeptidase